MPSPKLQDQARSQAPLGSFQTQSDTLVDFAAILNAAYDSSATAFRTTATISGDVNVDNLSVDTGGYIGKTTGGDFTVAYASATTLTLGTYPTTTAPAANDIVAIVQVSTAGAVLNTYTRDDKTLSVSGATLTVTGATFGATDTFVIYTNVPRVQSTGQADDSAFTFATTNVTPVGYVLDESGTDSIDENDVGAARMTANRVQLQTGPQAHDAAIDTTNTRPMVGGGRAADPTSLPTPVAAGDVSYAGYSLQQEALVYKSRLDAGEDQTNALQAVGIKQLSASTYSPSSVAATGSLPGNIKASAGVLKRVSISNFNAGVRFMHLFNSTGAPSGTPLISMPIGSNGNVMLDFGIEGRYFSTGISVGFSTGATSYTAGSAGDVSYFVEYN